MSISFMIIRQFRRCRRKNSNAAKHDIRKMALSIHSDIDKLKDEHTEMKQAIERTIYEKLAGIAYKAKALERVIQDSSISSEEEIPFLDGCNVTIRRACVETLRRVASYLWELPMEYTEGIREMIISDKPIHLSKIRKYMPINKPLNLLDDLYTKLSASPMYFREEVCRSCGWSLNTFFGRKGNRVRLQRKGILDHPLTEAEADKIISIFKETIIPALHETCITWEQHVKVNRRS